MKLAKTVIVVWGLWLCLAATLHSQDADVSADGFRPTNDLQRFEGCEFIKTDWCDGDSFLVKTKTGAEFTVRLYGVDCLESRTNDTTDARRLRAQRQYFGISKFGGSSKASIESAKKMGVEARDFVIEKLAKPFSVVTAFADGRGDKRFKRYYAFITTHDGQDLAALLVSQGHARAFGVARSTIDGKSKKEYTESLKDLELWAAKKSRGVWRATDWEALPEERKMARRDAEEIALAIGKPQLDAEEEIDVNSAARDDLMRLPGIGEAMANRIIEGRPYASLEQLKEVKGIGSKTFDKLKPHLKIK